MKHAILYFVVALLSSLASESRATGVSVFQNGKLHFSVGILFHLDYSYGHRIDMYGNMSYDYGTIDSLMMEGFDADSAGSASLSVVDSAQSIFITFKDNGVTRSLAFALDSIHGVCDVLYSAQVPGYLYNYRYDASFSSLPFHIVNGIFKLLPIPNDSLIAHLRYAKYDYHQFEGMFSTDLHSGYQGTTRASMEFNDVAVANVAMRLNDGFTIRSTSHSVLFTLPASAKSETLECFDLLGRKIFEQSFPPSSTPREIERTFSHTAVYIARYANHAQQFFSPR